MKLLKVTREVEELITKKKFKLGWQKKKRRRKILLIESDLKVRLDRLFKLKSLKNYYG